MTKYFKYFFPIVISLFIISACQSDADTANEKWEQERKAFINDIEAELAGLEANLEEFELQKATSELQQKYQDLLDNIHDFENSLDGLKTAKQQEWKELKIKVENNWDAIENQWDEIEVQLDASAN